ncbi:DUF2235 domain-containing protein [Nocardia sp. CDC159]|uniref:DUF2235 domain-containing protein n=1 Tax=Nocardia pulmonis TaxID=2951408 RepID=A0A9X2IXW8_9NOCA|nr:MULTISPECIES: DUF2235 domain-containing protein [Nocardia]MCM6773276.1 DUF2235 domain-containing protein [Nocardia pulmonis]MCM6786163.1 DUF2235 domain-containing protein [Nocardia sp. CDC159]
MKRLVVCCDGTWGAESNPTVSNIVKIAESVRMRHIGPTGKVVGQRVFYVDGPGSRGYLADKVLGGAFGLGLDANLSTMYWQLALNWEPGDEIYIFGFSRGAYTARSLAGMINRLGLLTADAMIDRKYPQALRIYRQRKANPDAPDPAEWVRFREENCHHPVPIKFLGVFDTVGAMGVPIVTSWRYRFHDVRLSPQVECARQALAINERRRIFAPCLWEVTDDEQRNPERVKQVWFKGVHTDIGGGYPDSRLSDITLRWMVDEAERQGLTFDRHRLEQLIARAPGFDNAVTPHNSLTVAYRVLNTLGKLVRPRNRRFYADSWRRLGDPAQQVYLSPTAQPCTEFCPPNVLRWERELAGSLPYEPATPVGSTETKLPQAITA